MESSKVWLVLGGSTGLGYAAVRYLVANNQTVIAITEGDDDRHIFSDLRQDGLFVIHWENTDSQTLIYELKAVGFDFRSIHYIVNNSNYKLFDQFEVKTERETRLAIESSIADTVGTLTALIAFVQDSPEVCLINLPPQLCLALLPDPTRAPNLTAAMDTFLNLMHKKLQTLNCKLKFLKPGERWAGL